MRWFGRGTEWVSLVLFRISTYILAAMCVSITYGVVMRYLFNKPPMWTNEFNGYFLAAMTLFACGYILLIDRHVKIDLILTRVPRKVNLSFRLFACLAAAVYAIIITWTGWETAYSDLLLSVKSATSLRTPLFYPKLVLPIGGFVLLLVAILRIVRHASELRGKDSPKILDTKRGNIR